VLREMGPGVGLGVGSLVTISLGTGVGVWVGVDVATALVTAGVMVGGSVLGFGGAEGAVVAADTGVGVAVDGVPCAEDLVGLPGLIGRYRRPRPGLCRVIRHRR
jgi:hypothetical protein